MSDVIDEFDDETSDQSHKDPVRAHLKKMEQENKLLRQQAAEFESLKRKMAFAEAGIDVNAPVAKYFIKGYEGEISPEAIRAAAEEAQILKPTQKEVADDSEKRAWDRLQRAGNASETANQELDLHTKINQARSQDEVMQLLAQANQLGNI
jgi:hypothetical protein